MLLSTVHIITVGLLLSCFEVIMDGGAAKDKTIRKVLRRIKYIWDERDSRFAGCFNIRDERDSREEV
jgi:hypothetical protein